MRFGIIPQNVNKYNYALCLYLLQLTKHVIWQSRNAAKFDHSKINNNTIVLRFLSSVKSRIRADFLRMPLSDFKQYWCSLQLICYVDNNKLFFSI
jgi:hypothetical protein